MNDIIMLARAYRGFLLELGAEFARVKNENKYDGVADSFVDAVKSPEVGFTMAEVNAMMKMYSMFCMLPVEDLPSHHSMKLMVNKHVNMDLLKDAQTLSVTDFKEKIKDEETGTQDRTYTYEIIKRCNETGNIKRVYDEELEEAKKQVALATN